jgi:ankyrin repeat protein
VASGKPGWLASYLTGIDPKLEVLKPAANFVERLIKKDLISSGGKCYTDGLFDTPSQQSLYQMFSIVAFLASNNMLSPLQIGHFLLWALDRGLVEQFSYVMRTKSDSVRACIEAILEGVTLLGQRFPAEIRHFLDLLISTLDLDLSKRLGGKLLHSFAGSSNVDAAKLLVSRGADINFVTTLNHAPIKYGTPLCAAILARDFPMVEYLITAGSDINKRCKTKSSEAVETALTMAIQIGRFEIAKFLLDRGAEFDMELRIEGYNILELAKLRLPKIYPVLLGRLAPENIPQLYQMIDAAEKGNRTLSRFLLDHKIVRGEVLEHALCHSVRMRNLGAVRTLLQRGIDPDVQRFRLVYNTIGCIDDIEDNLPILLAAACSKNDIASDLVYLLVKAGADLNDDVLMKICRLAIENGNTDLLRILAEAGLNAALFGPSGLEYIASEDENIYESGCILDWGTPINTYGMGGKSALQAAAGNGHLLLMQYLIDRGADINLLPSDDSGQTALQTAASAGFTEIVDYLIDVGADVKAPPAKKHGVTVLEAAAGAFHGYEHESESEIRHQEEEKLECTFKNLLALGAPINRADGSSSCVLHRLIRMSRSECLKLAVQAGARIEDREKRRGLKTPLQVAADEGDMEAIQLLLDHGADINSPPGDEFGRTALQAATSARNPDPRIIQLLLSHGADVNARPARKGGVTALQGAAISGDLQIARMLLGYAADVNAASAPEKGRTSLEGAAEHGRLDMVQLLLSRGVKADPIMGFSRAIELAEGNEHFVIADLLRGNEKASHFLLTELDDSLLGLPAQSLPPQGMVFPYAGF